MPGLEPFVVQMSVFFLQVELHPVVKTSDFRSGSGLPDKDVFKSAGVRAATQTETPSRFDGDTSVVIVSKEKTQLSLTRCLSDGCRDGTRSN